MTIFTMKKLVLDRWSISENIFKISNSVSSVKLSYGKFGNGTDQNDYLKIDYSFNDSIHLQTMMKADAVLSLLSRMSPKNDIISWEVDSANGEIIVKYWDKDKEEN